MNIFLLSGPLKLLRAYTAIYWYLGVSTPHMQIRVMQIIILNYFSIFYRC